MKSYKLVGHKPVLVDTTSEWALWFQNADRHVAKDEFNDVRVSTVFLGIDHNVGGKGPPHLFETMIFGGSHDGYTERCATWEQAEAMHKRACDLVLDSPPETPGALKHR